jgi:hypothetical protein
MENIKDSRGMNSSTIFFTLLYGAAFFFVAYWILMSMGRPVPMIRTEMEPIVISEASWWPLPQTSYNRWPYWAGWWMGGKDGGYQRPVHPQRAQLEKQSH